MAPILPKEKLLMITYTQKALSPTLFDLQHNRPIGISLKPTIKSCRFLDDQVLYAQNTDDSVELLHMQTKKRILLGKLWEDKLKKITDHIVWASCQDGSKKIIDTQHCKILRTFEPHEKATLNNKLLWYKEDTHTHKIIALKALLGKL